MALIANKKQYFKNDYYRLVRSENRKCPDCKQITSRLYSIRVENDGRTYLDFNCSNCGTDHYVWITRARLEKIMFEFLYNGTAKMADFARCFRLGYYYPQLFKNQKYKERYDHLATNFLERNKQWGWWYKIKYWRKRNGLNRLDS